MYYLVGLRSDIKPLLQYRANDGFNVDENEMICGVVSCIEVSTGYWPAKDISLLFRIREPQSLKEIQQLDPTPDGTIY